MALVLAIKVAYPVVTAVLHTLAPATDGVVPDLVWVGDNLTVVALVATMAAVVVDTMAAAVAVTMAATQNKLLK